MAKPLVALVGRPNVGKSTLFNRLVGERVAIVEDLPGTTRDRIYGEFEWRGRDVAVVDTGGIVTGSGEELPESVLAQAQVAIQEADLILFLVDQRAGVTAMDAEIADLLRRTSKPLMLVVNKVDNVKQELGSTEFHELGLSEPVLLSALRGMRTGDLLDEIVERLPPPVEEEELEEAVRIAIVGRPNVGKSSLLNALTGEARAVVSPIPGTTRDAVDMAIDYRGQEVILVDTAGIRRAGRIGLGLERYSVLRSMRAIDRADVAVLVIDATESVVAQDTHVAGFVQEKGKGLVIAVNKWDLIEKDSHTAAQYEQKIHEALKFMQSAPIVFLSAKTGQRVERVLDAALTVAGNRTKRVSTGQLNEAIHQLLAQRQQLSAGGKLLKVFYVTEAAVEPPTFVFMVNDPTLVHFALRRFFENRLRELFGFEGTPLRLIFRARGKEPKA
ncbi:MAG: ribosome biogenesis GTPase Der [Chloroflexota bacterium]